jgi:integrase
VGAADNDTFSGRRDGLLFRLLFHTGARVSEILALRRQDIHWGQMTTVQLRGKGRKQRAVPLLKSMAADLKRYLADQPADPFAPVFTNRFGQSLSRSGVEKRLHLAVNRAAQQCPSLKGRAISPHTFRHYADLRTMPIGMEIMLFPAWFSILCAA